MDYLGMLGFSFIFLGGSLLFGLAAYKVHMWWQAHKSNAAIRQLEDEHYVGLRESLLSHIDELLKEVDR